MMLTFTVVVPAAGIGSRMGAACPKQYLPLAGKFLIEHTLDRLLSHPRIAQVVVAIAPDDDFFATLPLASHPRVSVIHGGTVRAESVLNGLSLVKTEWVLVHDAARPCITHHDIDLLIHEGLAGDGGLLGSRVRDTMKRSDTSGHVVRTVDRSDLWHALTPQFFRCLELQQALQDALGRGAMITDEASAMELAGWRPRMVEGRADNIKVTRPEDLVLAALFLNQQEKET